MAEKQPTITEIRDWGKGKDFGENVLQLYKGVKIVDRNKFFKSHIDRLEAVRGLEGDFSRLMIYYHRLVQFKKLVDKEEEKQRGD